MIRFLCLALSGLLLAACASVTTQVDAISAIPEGVEPKTVYITPAPGMDGNSLAWQQYSRVLAGVLLGKGYTPLASRSGARLVAAFGYQIDNGEKVTTQYSVPERGIIGYRNVSRPGPNGGTIQDTVPIWGVVGYDWRTRTDIVFTAQVSINMTDSRTGKRAFEGRGLNRGPCSNFAPLAAPMIGAVLSDFPAGRQGRVTIETEGAC